MTNNERQTQESGIVTSLGSGTGAEERSNQRWYDTAESPLLSVSQIRNRWQSNREQAAENGLRRSVMRFITDAETAAAVQEDTSLPVEFVLPLRIVSPDQNDDRCLVLMGQNYQVSDDVRATRPDEFVELPTGTVLHRDDHQRLLREWGAFAHFWEHYQLQHTPVSRVQRLDDEFQMTAMPNSGDVETLAALWQAFSWDEAGAAAFIRAMANGNQDYFFSGVRDSEGILRAAMMAERMQYLDTLLIELTEFATDADYRGRGLSTAALIGLIAQIVEATDRIFENEEIIPVITAEFNLSSRSDVVGAHAGMTIPMIHGIHHDLERLTQVLLHNVEVYDDQAENAVSPDHFTEAERAHYGAMFEDGNRHRFWRNFVPGVLAATNRHKYYGPEDRATILTNYHDNPRG